MKTPIGGKQRLPPRLCICLLSPFFHLFLLTTAPVSAIILFAPKRCNMLSVQRTLKREFHISGQHAVGDVCDRRRRRFKGAKRSGHGRNLASECALQISGTATGRASANFISRGVAQLVARDVWDVDAAGSNPVTPTKFGFGKQFPKPFSLFPPTQILRADGFVSPRFLSSSRQIGILLSLFQFSNCRIVQDIKLVRCNFF